MDSYLYWCPKTIEMIYGNKTPKSVKNTILTQKQKLVNENEELKREIEKLKQENEELKKNLNK